ncbi:MAG: glycosyltransferase family 2 protein [Sphingomicrobium sp.]
MVGLLVSVIVPVFNREAMIGATVASLASQTLDNFEIIVVDDGSTDASAEVAERAGGKRVRVIGHGANRGIPAARNTGLEAARGKYIAWLDSDDLARPRRLKRQAEFLARHPEIALVGSASGRIGPDGQARRGTMPFISHETLAPALLFRSPFQQSSIMGVARTLKDFEYRAEFPVCEDLDMFIRISRKHRLANVREALIDRRLHEGQIGAVESALVRDRMRALLRKSLEELGLEPSEADLDRHITLGTLQQRPQSREFLGWAETWMKLLRARNEDAGVYNSRGLALVCARAWVRACYVSLHGNQRGAVARVMLTSSLMMGFASSDAIEWLAQLLTPPAVAGLSRNTTQDS